MRLAIILGAVLIANAVNPASIDTLTIVSKIVLAITCVFAGICDLIELR